MECDVHVTTYDDSRDARMNLMILPILSNLKLKKSTMELLRLPVLIELYCMLPRNSKFDSPSDLKYPESAFEDSPRNSEKQQS